VISIDTVFGTSPGVQTDPHLVQSRRVDFARDASGWREGFFGRFVGDELELEWMGSASTKPVSCMQSDCAGVIPYRPEEASASDVADVRVAVEVLVQELAQVLSVLADVFDQVFFFHDLLDFKCGGAAYRVALVGVSVGESTGWIRL